MAHIRDYLHNPMWAFAYEQGLYNQDAVNSNFIELRRKNATFTPIYPFSSDRYSIHMNRHGAAHKTYDAGVQAYNGRYFQQLENCTDATGNPDMCADEVLGIRRDDVNNFYRQSKYTW